MNIVPAKPDVWYRTPAGRLIPPYFRHPERVIVATTAGLVMTRCPRRVPEFDPSKDVIHRAWW